MVVAEEEDEIGPPGHLGSAVIRRTDRRSDPCDGRQVRHPMKRIPDVIESARGMGMRPRKILLEVELPLAASLIIAGVRTSAVQVIATAPLGALIAWGGLGRFIIDGLAIQDYAQVAGGAILVALFSIAAELGFGLLEQRLTPGGRRRSFAPGARRPDVELEQVIKPSTVGT